jgi:hypothetical protein
LLIVAMYAASFIAFGFVVDSPEKIVRGLIEILTTRDALLTDYIGVGGVGAAFVSAGLLTLCSSLVYYLSGAKISGASVACLFLVLGFGLFGKNLLNVWFIVIGVLLYARFKGEPFSTHINTAFFGAALAPIFSEILFSTSLTPPVSLPLAVAVALLLGFVLPPAASQLFKAHMGFSLYNMGFTAGIVGTLIVALFKSYGYVPDPVMVWARGNNVMLGVFSLAVFSSMIALGFYLNPFVLPKMKGLMALPGQSPTDFIALAGFDVTLVNMGLTGLIGTAYVLIVGSDLNGPTIGAILTIVGFAAFGKHPRNILPIMVGVFVGSLGKPWAISDPSIVLAALFGTTLAPIAGRFGWHWGIVAGFVHSSAALSVGQVHAGLNLYNNGFAAGIVAAVLVPVIMAFQPKQDQDDKTARPTPALSPD